MPTSSAELSRRFLAAVWTLQRADSGYIVASVKSPSGQWLDIAGSAEEVTTEEWPNDPLKRRGDIYFAPCIFGEPARTNAAALDEQRWLYADLDEVDPRTLALKPTVAIESSPGRYQAMWLLTRPLDIRRFRSLNQRLTYATGADKGGWSQNKVLRVPGTRNRKYAQSPRVRLMWFKPKRKYAPRDVLAFVKDEADATDAPASVDATLPDLPNTTAAHLRRRYKSKLKRRARKLLTVRKVVAGEDRSARMWELENLCMDAGMTPEETLIVVRSCVYNKYKGQRRETRMLWTEIQKAVATRERKQAEDPEPDDDPEPEEDTSPLGLAPTRLARYLAKDVRPPSWLVQNIWGRAAHGVWAGDFKTYKSTLLMDLAVSVTSGRPFLGEFPVHRTGPVLYVQEENSHGFMHDRLHRIVQAKGLGNVVHTNGSRSRSKVTIEFGHDLDLHLLNLSGFDLTQQSHLNGLDEWCHMHQPALVILDPLYRLAPGLDENSAAEMAPVINPLADISNQNDCALILAHHYNKPTASNHGMRAGHRIAGTGAFSRWWESSVYAEHIGDPDSYSIKFHTEHREHGTAAPQMVTVEMRSDDPDTYAIHLADIEEEAKHAEDDGDGLMLDKRTTRVAVMTVRSKLGLDSSKAAQKLLKDKGYAVRKPEGTNKLWAYPPER